MKKLKTLFLSCFLLTIGLSYSQEIFFFDEHGNELGNRLVIVETNSLDTLISSKNGLLEINNIDRLKSVEINVTNIVKCRKYFFNIESKNLGSKSIKSNVLSIFWFIIL